VDLKQASAIAEHYREEMRPYVERIQIAGSVRRGCPQVRDIELVAIPKFEPIPHDGASLFDNRTEEESLNLLHRWATRGEGTSIRWIKPGTSEIVTWEPKPDGKYWRGLLREGIKLDLFLCRRENWGLILAIRTGSAEFSQALVTHARDIGMPSIEGYLTNAGQRIVTPEEHDVFDQLQLNYVDPLDRTGREKLRHRNGGFKHA
jgi:DNA polymerase/3'-5' exonuclease PolX